jgi:hypothetical protein
MIYAGATPPQYAADAAGNVYVSPLDEYQVFAYALDGSMCWALQVPTERVGVADDEKAWATDWFRSQRYPNIGQSDIDWPDHAYALADMKVDARAGTVWQTARGDRIYGVIENPDTGVHEVVRYRLEIPDATEPHD